MRMTLLSGVLALTAIAGAAHAADLRITSWGGAYTESQREAYFKPYTAATGTKIIEDEYSGEIAKIRAMVESGSVTWDVVDVDTQTARQACDEGLILPNDWEKIGVPKEKMIGSDAFECGVTTILYSTIIAYDTTKLTPAPTSVADLFDLAKFPGKRGLQKNPYGNLEFALIADGVPLDKVYETLSTPEGVDRAFAKLDTIKGSVVWWEAGAQPPQLLADGEVVMTTAWNGRIQTAIDKDGKPFKIIWEGQLPDYDLWAIPKGSPNTDAAWAFIAWASKADVMANQSKYIAYGPANVDAAPFVDAAVLPKLPSAPENLKVALFTDYDYWGNNGEELRRRFNTWLAQ
ncbi:ABC transporter substrate-binding protein [Zavarzinia sp. CC-PAN008]|uniref:ABC transporter substrate-binding protein n=1 Tax=Zavarzinia sp. CC-PAN008 TaxID=3243332 RepID=UPI003F745317